MKRGYRWAGIVGGLLIIIFLVGGATALSNPSSIVLVNVATGVTDGLWVCLGVFLILVYLKGKQAEDAGHVPAVLTPNSPEDKEALRKKRNWIFGYVILFEIIASAESWVLNNYAAGFTPINVGTVFDLLFNGVLLYIAIQLFRGKKNVTKPLLCVIVAYTLEGMAIAAWRHHWLGIVAGLLFGLYFVYAIKAPLDRKHFRIAHMVILPVFLVLTLVFNAFDNTKINQSLKDETKLEQQFSNETSDITTAYLAFLKTPTPAAADIQDVEDALQKRDEKDREVMAALDQLQSQYEWEIPSIVQVKTLDRIKKTKVLFGIHRQQAEKLREFMAYAKTVNFGDLTEQQKTDIRNFTKDIDALSGQIRDAALALDEQ